VNDPLLFLLAVGMLLATPGPTNTLMATAGASDGVQRSLALLAAELFGYLIAIAAIRIVLGPIIQVYPSAGTALKLAVAGYLIWLAVKLWRNPMAKNAAKPVSFSAVFITTLLNPKALMFALTIIPQGTPNLAWYLAMFSGTVLAAGFGWILLGVTLGAAAGQGSAVLPRVASVALLGFAGLIAASAL
jgi:threonine/homoserine/homoserine lactone efflux protein